MDAAWSTDFSYAFFKRILVAARSNFKFQLFSDAPEVLQIAGNFSLFLRHDVDVDLKKALAMAALENELSVRSTYMVMINSPFYDVDDQNSRNILKELIGMGHEIGLHFNMDSPKKAKADIKSNEVEEEVRRDIKRLEDVICQRVPSVSFHRPSAGFLRGPMIVGGAVNAYSKDLMEWYLSDSEGKWREGNPLPKLMAPSNKILQLLIHPIWWSKKHLSAGDNLEEYFQSLGGIKSDEDVRIFDANLFDHIAIHRSGFRADQTQGHLPETGRFNTDTNALIQRISSHDKFGTQDLNSWIFSHMDLKSGMSVLDLGCGTGKQSIPLLELLGESGRVTAFDISEKSLDILKKKSREKNLNEKLTTICGDLDELEEFIVGRLFDQALASYSLYYAKDPQRVLQVIHQRLHPGGSFFFCGPSKGNNLELREFHRKLLRKPATEVNKTEEFMEETASILARKIYNSVSVFSFENPLEFDSPDALYNYWSSYNLYNNEIDADFRIAAAQYFKSNNKFVTVKRVIGVYATKGIS